MSMHLLQLQQACLGLAATINAALTEAELTPLDEMVAGDSQASGKPASNKRPRIVVSLAGSHGREAMSGIGGGLVLDTVTVEFAVQIDGTEALALAYEGVVAGVVRAEQATLRAAVTDASLDRWLLTDGSLERDETRRNAKGWTAMVAALATMQW